MSEEIIKSLKILSKEKDKDSLVALLRDIKKDDILKNIREKITEKLKSRKKLFEFQFYDGDNPIDVDVEEDMNLNDIKLFEDSKENNYKIYILKNENSTESTSLNETTVKQSSPESNISLNNKVDTKNIQEEQSSQPTNGKLPNKSMEKNEGYNELSSANDMKNISGNAINDLHSSNI